MAHLNEPLSTKREYDAIEQALAARPLLRAPRHTSSRVLAQIMALSPAESTRKALPVAALYAIPAVRPLGYYDSGSNESQPPPRLLAGYIFTGAWSGLCLFLMWLVWPAISNLFFGPSTDPEMQGRLEFLQAGWSNVYGLITDFLRTYDPLLPSLLSALLGLAVMAAILYRSSFKQNTLA